MPDIKISDLSFSYGKRKVLSDLSLSFSGTGIYTLTGPSGSGKTTLLRLLLGLERPARGSVTLSEPPAAAFQEYRLFPQLTAEENVALTAPDPKASLADAHSALLSLGFSEQDCRLYPSQLSGGMKQRVSLARALFADSRILLLDEPSKELDAPLRELLYEALRSRAKDSLILLTTHRTEETEILNAKNVTVS